MTISPAAAVPIVPLEVLFGNPEKASPQVSPDGRSIAYLAPHEGVLNIWIRSVDGGDDRPVTRDRDRGIRRYFWSEDGRALLYLQDRGGNEDWRLWSADPAGSTAPRELTPYENVQVRLIDTDRANPRRLLVALNLRDARVHDAHRLDLETGRLETAATNPGNVAGWMADADLRVRAAVAVRPDGGEDLLVRDDESSEWRTAVSWNREDAASSGPVAFTRDGRSIYLQDARGSDTGRLVLLDLDTGRLTELASDPGHDVGTVVIHPETRLAQMAAFVRERQEWTVLDPSVREDVEALARLHRGDFYLTSRDRADRFWTVAHVPDNGPVVYHLYDRLDRSARLLFKSRPDLDGYRLAEMEPFEYRARDGLLVHGYLTFPPGAPRSGLPVVLDVHGGPWHRDTWGFDPEAQWLANRGYLCVQVNYRGSTGYGKRFVSAGDKEWGGRMQDDLTDALGWVVARGYADPKRACIFGGSYGGYAALAGVTFTPDLYACAVDLVGPSNLISFIETVPPYWSAYLSQLKRRVGDPATEAGFLRSRSPLEHVERIRVPVFIAQGANDPRVKRAESEQIVEAMRAKGIDHEYLLFEDEGHGFAKPSNRLKFYRSCEAFLAKHLGGRVETARD